MSTMFFEKLKKAQDLARQRTVEPPPYDTDIRVGDLVEVVSWDEKAMLQAGFRKGQSVAAEVGFRGVVASRNKSGYGEQTFCAFDEPKVCAAHGRFRILERGGKPYVRCGTYDNAAQVVTMPDGSKMTTKEVYDWLAAPDAKPEPPDSVVVAGGRLRECLDASADRMLLKQLAEEHEPPKCAWCGEGDAPGCVGRDGATSPLCVACQPYWSALQSRLSAGGAHDCPEERESVRRWVDGQRPAIVCLRDECGKPTTSQYHICNDCGGLHPDDRGSLDQRIREAQPDQSTAAAGMTAAWEWP